MTDSGSLQRFVEAQDHEGTFDRALAELRAGRKSSHWMWFVFPQLAGLGRSEMAQRFAIGSLAEARAYAAHPVLGTRLKQCATVLLELPATVDAQDVMGSEIDALKLHSSMTLFVRAAPDEPSFRRVLGRYFAGEPDPRTDRLLAGRAPGAGPSHPGVGQPPSP